ncbi:hypothetical protein PV04_07523 [Phialophora macrospora]|uniref:Uncharacterized protein n=1 Tax=Phialophora macrospora TaxID=1851006 RepID=A0A0D2FZE0_9EURO|nr:hypothetical protein PV04_07523 [Phialophora macrospora]
MRFRDTTPELPSPSRRKRWRSITLRLWCVPLLLFAELALIVAISTLFALSRQRTGFVEIGFEERSLDFSTFPGAVRWGQGLLWTALPVFTIGLYKLFRDAVIAALVVETPYIELARSSPDKPVEARKSIYLDYRTSFAIVACWKAWKNKHYILSICLVLSFVEALGLVPLTARLFAAREELLPKEATVNVLSTFDTSAPLADTNYGSLMDAVSASWVNESPLPRGTDGDFAFSQIAPMQHEGNFTVSAPTNASRLTMDCAEVPTSLTSITLVEETDSFVTVRFSATDRGCDIEGSIPTETDGNDFLEATLTSNCSETAGRLRIGFFYGAMSTTGVLTNSTLVSCIPSYWSAHGILTVVNTNNTLSGRVVETPKFNATGHDLQDLGITAQQFEDGVMTVQTFNPATSSVGNTNAPLRLAELVVRRIETLGQSYSADTLIDAVNLVYPAIYTMLAVTYFYPELATPVAVTGTLAVPQNRLHVVPPVAISMLVILVILFASTAYLISYLGYHPSILAEEPVGLLGAASLLRGSNIADILEKFHQKGEFDGRLSRELHENSNNNNEKQKEKKKKKRLDDQLKEKVCWIVRGERPHELIIMMDGRNDSHDMNGGSAGGEDDSQGPLNEAASRMLNGQTTTRNGRAAGGEKYDRVPGHEQDQAQEREAVYELGMEPASRPELGPGLGPRQAQRAIPSPSPIQTPLPTPSPDISGQYYDYGSSYSNGYRHTSVDGGFVTETSTSVPTTVPGGMRRKPVQSNNKNIGYGYGYETYH